MEAHSEGEWLEQTAQQAQRLFGFVKGGAGNLIKNIKDTSSKMMHTVAGYVADPCCVSSLVLTPAHMHEYCIAGK